MFRVWWVFWNAVFTTIMAFMALILWITIPLFIVVTPWDLVVYLTNANWKTSGFSIPAASLLGAVTAGVILKLISPLRSACAEELSRSSTTEGRGRIDSPLEKAESVVIKPGSDYRRKLGYDE